MSDFAALTALKNIYVEGNGIDSSEAERYALGHDCNVYYGQDEESTTSDKGE